MQKNSIEWWFNHIPDPEIRGKALANMQHSYMILSSYHNALFWGVPAILFNELWHKEAMNECNAWPLPEQEEQVTWDDVLNGYGTHIIEDIPALYQYLQENYEPPKRKVI